MTDSTAPTPPSLDRAVSVSPSEIKLSWGVPYDAVGVTAYKVYRDGNLVVTTGTSPRWVDPGLTANTSYTYYVTALDAALNEFNPSNSITLKTLVDPGAAATASASAAALGHGLAEIDFGSTPVADGTFVITDTEISLSSHIVAKVSYTAPTGKDQDEVEMDDIMIRCVASDGSFTAFVHATDGSYLADKFKITYTAR